MRSFFLKYKHNMIIINRLDFVFLGIDSEEELLNISKNRKQEIENKKVAATIDKKLEDLIIKKN